MRLQMWHCHCQRRGSTGGGGKVAVRRFFVRSVVDAAVLSWFGNDKGSFGEKGDGGRASLEDLNGFVMVSLAGIVADRLADSGSLDVVRVINQD